MYFLFILFNRILKPRASKIRIKDLVGIQVRSSATIRPESGLEPPRPRPYVGPAALANSKGILNVDDTTLARHSRWDILHSVPRNIKGLGNLGYYPAYHVFTSAHNTSISSRRRLACPQTITPTKLINMSSPTSPASYSSLSFKDISVSHVPADSPTATKVLVVALNRPTKYNAVTENLLDELEAIYTLINSDERVRAVILTGNGKAFCAGADLEVGFGGLLAHKKSPEAFDKFRDQYAHPYTWLSFND